MFRVLTTLINFVLPRQCRAPCVRHNRSVAGVGTRLRAEFRARWRTLVALGLLGGLAFGAVLLAAAGARRTTSAYPRFLRSTAAADYLVGPYGPAFDGFFPALERLPEVAASARVRVLDLAIAEPHGRASTNFGAVAGVDRAFASRVERPDVTAGRIYRPGATDEVVIDHALARAEHARVGSHLIVAPYDASGAIPHHAPRFRLRVVGVVSTRDSAVAINSLSPYGGMLLAPATGARLLHDGVNSDTIGAYVRLKTGASRTNFNAAVQRLAPKYQSSSQGLFVADESQQDAQVLEAIRPQSTALAIFAFLAALGAVFAIGQIVSRQLLLASTDHPTLWALGMDRWQLVVLAVVPVAIVAVLAALVAAVLAVVASPLVLFGAARAVDPSPGIAADWFVLGIGALTIIVFLLVRACWPAWRASAPNVLRRAEAVEPRARRLAQAAGRIGSPVSAGIGVRLALDPGAGRRAVPVRAALIGSVVAISAVAAAVTFGTNLVHLVRAPAAYGQTWDVTLDAGFGSVPARDVRTMLARSGVHSWSAGYYGDVAAGRRQIPAIGIEPGHGPLLFPRLLEGHAPTAPNQIVLGSKTLRRLHRRVGDTVRITIGDKPTNVRIVGRAVFPAFGRGSFTPTGLGEGAAVYAPLLAATDPANAHNGGGFNFVLVRSAAPQTRARIASVYSKYFCPEGCHSLLSQAPGDVRSYRRIEAMPLLLAALLALLAVAAVTHVVVSSTRRRRQDLAVLKSLGLRRAQVSAVVVWQSTTFVVIGLAIGLPLGVAAGRAIWSHWAGNLGIGTFARVAGAPLVLAVPIGLAVAFALALGPALVAGRLRPSSVLRTE